MDQNMMLYLNSIRDLCRQVDATSMATFRSARDDEDEVLGRVIHNAFRLHWYVALFPSMKSY